MLDIPSQLKKLALTTEDAIVIGSGILNALGIRVSNDIDLVVSEGVWSHLEAESRFESKENHGETILTDEVFEIGLAWNVLSERYDFPKLFPHTKVIDGVRYIDLDFLTRVKESWIACGEGRPKDLADIGLIQEYRKK